MSSTTKPLKDMESWYKATLVKYWKSQRSDDERIKSEAYATMRTMTDMLDWIYSDFEPIRETWIEEAFNDLWKEKRS